MESKLRVGVLGTGSLGRHHARIYSELAKAGQVEFSGIYDVVPDSAKAVSENLGGVPVFRSVDDLVQHCDAVSIVTPTVTHHDLAKQLLMQHKHVLVEKPMCDHADQAYELARLAGEQNCVLQVGHVERFNPVFGFLQKAATDPRFIETHRLSPYPARSTDIGVALDLLIHDLDAVLAFVKSPVIHVDAVGIPVLSDSEDIVNARLNFANGCVANMTASRVSPDRMRKIRVFSGGATPCYISLDYKEQKGYIYRMAREDEKESNIFKKLLAAATPVLSNSAIVSEFRGKRIVREPAPIEKEEPLKLELTSFVDCVKTHHAPVVTGEFACRALDLAFEITRQIKEKMSKELKR